MEGSAAGVAVMMTASGMAEPGDQLAEGHGRLRASHADRERVIAVLRAALAQGRLDRDEYELRATRALASRTYAELAVFTADIPPGPAAACLPESTPGVANGAAIVAMAWTTGTLIGIWPVLMLTPAGSPFAIPVVVAFFVLAMVVPTGWLILLHDWLDQRADRQSAPGLPPASGLSTDCG